jgi:hypothetical protein
VKDDTKLIPEIASGLAEVVAKIDMITGNETSMAETTNELHLITC